MNTPIINIRQLNKGFGQHSVLRDLNWQIAPGRVIGLLGRNGAGKSTLLECLLGLRQPDSGSIELLGATPGQLSDAERAKIGFVPQQSDLFEWLTPRQMLSYFQTFYPRWNNAKVAGLLQRWGFEALGEKRIGQLSGGEQQRLSIIRALAHDPELLILDEPVASLDPFGRREFLRELIDGVIEKNTTVIFSTHILSDLERVAMELAFLKDGQIMLQGALDQLLEGVHRVSGPRDLLAGLPPPIRALPARNGQSAQLMQLEPDWRTKLASHPEIRIETLNLEDLFVEVTQ
jgi:ABC-2 type transport system ATP-binding protein